MINNQKISSSNEYNSIRYLNMFRLLLSIFFYLKIFTGIEASISYKYSQDLASIIAGFYLSFAVIVWFISGLYKSKIITIGLASLIIDLPFIISLTLLMDGLNNGWVILAVITIGSFSIISHKSWSIFAMPVIAVIMLAVLPRLLGLNNVEKEIPNIIMYTFIYFAIAFVGIRQSQSYNQSVLLTTLQRKKIMNLSVLNSIIIKQMQSGVVAFDKNFKVIQINNKANEVVKAKAGQLLPPVLIEKITSAPEAKNINASIYGEDIIITIVIADKIEEISLMFVEKQADINKKAQQANLATIGKLSATIAHELRNPMSAIFSSSELLQESETIDSEDSELLDIIVSQIARSNSIIDDILMMSKPHIAEQTRINLSLVLEEFKLYYSEQKNIDINTITIKKDNSISLISFDISHLNQLLWNLTENAFKHGEDNHVSIEVNNQTNYVLIDFINNGKTFSQNTEENLFTPFFTTHTKGTGLGLFICKEMCISNNAKLEYLRPESQHIFRIHVKK